MGQGRASSLQTGTSFTSGTWQELTIIEANNTSYFYAGTTLVSSAARTPGTTTLSNPMLGFGDGGTDGTNVTLDSLRLWSFTSGDSVASVQNSIFSPSALYWTGTSSGSWGTASCWARTSPAARRPPCPPGCDTTAYFGASSMTTT